MYSYFDLQFWFYFLYFIAAFFVSVYIPGYVITRLLPVKSIPVQVLLSCVLGVVLWAVQGYIFGYLHLRFLTYPYVLVFLILFLKYRNEFRLKIHRIVSHHKSFDKVALILIIAGVVIQTFPTFASGMRYGDGVRFFHVNSTDGVLHLGYIQSMIGTFPPEEPGINSPLVNYHYWSDLVIAEFARVWKLPVLHLFFQFFVPVISLITGIAVYLLVRTWRGSRNVARWALFLLFFSGDAAYLFMILLHQKVSFTSPAIDNGILQFLNMPHAMAKMIFITALIPLYHWIKTKDIRMGVLAMTLFSVLVGFKVYYGIFVALGLTFLGVSAVVNGIIENSRKNGLGKGIVHGILGQKYLIGLTLAFAFIGACIYFPPNKASGGLFYSPLEWPKLFLGAGALEFQEWWLRRQVYEQANNIKALLVYDTVAVLITLISIYGTRLLGFLPTKQLLKNLGFELSFFLIPAVLVFNFLGLYTLQESGLFNVYNFFVVSSIILSLFAAFTLGSIQKIKRVGVIFCVIFVLITLPRMIFEGNVLLRLYTSEFRLSPLVSNTELETLSFIQKNTPSDAIIQTHVRNSWDQVTPYTVFFSDRNTYLTGTGLLETHNQPVREREVELEKLFKSPNSGEFAQSMRNLKIDYVVVKKDKDQILPFLIERPFLEIKFENKDYLVVEDISNK